MSDSLAVLGALGGALLGAMVVGILAPLFLDRHRSPKLQILRKDDQNVEDNGATCYHRVLVRNNGRRAAINCVGVISLQAVKSKDVIAGGILDPGSFGDGRCLEREMLTWTFWPGGQNPSHLSINPKTQERLHVYRVLRKKVTGGFVLRKKVSFRPVKLVIPSERGWNPPRVILQPGDYSGEITVSAENADPVTQKIFVRQDTGVDCVLHFKARA